MMVDMMKKNMSVMVPNMLMMGWASYFFAGFVIAKVPFGLMDRFRMMLQRGIDLDTLDVSYVSSMSWYFLNMFGLRGLFTLVLGQDNETDDARMMQQQMGGGMMGGPGHAPDVNKMYADERANLGLVQHAWV